MIIVKAMGGLGNQLQQYALYKKLESMGRDVRLDISWFQNPQMHSDILAKRDLELDYFEGISYRAAEPEDIKSVLGRTFDEKESVKSKLKRKFLPSTNPCFTETDMYHEQIFSFTDKYLEGYWACEKYYADTLPALRAQIRFPINSDNENRIRNEETIHKMEETESVSVHIRRGDYLDGTNRAIFGGICTEDYYHAAIDFIRERKPEARFFFFSDDIPYVKEHYQGENYEMIDWNHGKNSFYDMMLMSRCKHNICANSTFSFWGARLNPNASKLMIRPSIHKNTQVFIPEQMQELWHDWILITPQGKVVGGER